VTRDVETPYSGMLPGLVAGAYTHDECHGARHSAACMHVGTWRACLHCAARCAALHARRAPLPSLTRTRARPVDLRKLCSWARVRLVHASATGLDLDARAVLLSDGRPPLSYDVLSLDVGIAPAAADVPGAAAHAVPVKPIDGFAARWAQLRRDEEGGGGGEADGDDPAPAADAAAAAAAPLRVAVVGGGAGGVELALAMHTAGSARAAATSASRADAGAGASTSAASSPSSSRSLCVSLVTRGALLPSHAPGVRSRVASALAARGVALHARSPVASVAPDGTLHLADGRQLPCDAVVWCTQAAALPWLAASGLACDASGCVRVDACLQSVSHRGVFAAGDCAALDASPRPKAGVFAVRAGPPLTANLRAALSGGDAARLTPWAPQRTNLALISLGNGAAVASYGGFGLGGDSALGRFLYRLKDGIDRKWMRMYTHLPPMAPMRAGAHAQQQPSEALAAAAGAEGTLALAASRAMRCGGCGAKVGAGVLSRVLARLDAPTRPEVTIGIGAAADDAAAITLPPGASVIASIDYFRSFLDDPFTLGAVAATHALGDAWAMGAEPIAALALAQVPAGTDTQTERELGALLAGVCASLRAADVALAGGHSCEGAELACGLSIIAAGGARLLTKGGLRPGDVLLLTKPLGTGVLMAANAAAAAPGRAVAAALASMRAPSGGAATALAAHGARGATDVTGFGLLGHALEMARSSRCRIELHLDALPLLPCAAALAASGVASSLAPANARSAAAAEHAPGVTTCAAYPLLFDPQTAGGLLAGVPPERAAEALAALRAAGAPHAAAVGVVLPAASAEEGSELQRPIVLRVAAPQA
jgi:selenide,water dikinase